MVALIHLTDEKVPGTEIVVTERAEVVGWLIAPDLPTLCRLIEGRLFREKDVLQRAALQHTLNAIVRAVLPGATAGTKYDFHNGYVLLTQ